MNEIEELKKTDRTQLISFHLFEYIPFVAAGAYLVGGAWGVTPPPQLSEFSYERLYLVSNFIKAIFF